MAGTVPAGATFRAARRTLQAAGYTPGPPACAVTRDADRAICERLRCACGHHGLAYQPFLRARPAPRRGADYRILAACPRCGRCEEL